MIKETTIPCPECKSKIVISISLLLEGKSFTCSNLNCGATISLNIDSKSAVDDALNKFNQLKKRN